MESFSTTGKWNRACAWINAAALSAIFSVKGLNREGIAEVRQFVAFGAQTVVSDVVGMNSERAELAGEPSY